MEDENKDMMQNGAEMDAEMDGKMPEGEMPKKPVMPGEEVDGDMDKEDEGEESEDKM